MPDNLGALGDSIGPLLCYLGLPRRFPGCTRGFNRFFRMFPMFTLEVPYVYLGDALGLPIRFPGCTRGFKRFFRMFPRFTYEVP
jgi:hypothetical protein